jgi:hypothetical protein
MLCGVLSYLGQYSTVLQEPFLELLEDHLLCHYQNLCPIWQGPPSRCTRLFEMRHKVAPSGDRGHIMPLHPERRTLLVWSFMTPVGVSGPSLARAKYPDVTLCVSAFAYITDHAMLLTCVAQVTMLWRKALVLAATSALATAGESRPIYPQLPSATTFWVDPSTYSTTWYHSTAGHFIITSTMRTCPQLLNYDLWRGFELTLNASSSCSMSTSLSPAGRVHP